MLQNIGNTLLELNLVFVFGFMIICFAVVVYFARRVAVIKTYLQNGDQAYHQAQNAQTDSERKAAYTEMQSCYAKAAGLGSAQAITCLGHIYREGLGVKPDLVKAYEYYQKGARKSFHEAQYHLGLLYEKGEGVTQDLKKAAHWKKRSQSGRFRVGF